MLNKHSYKWKSRNRENGQKLNKIRQFCSTSLRLTVRPRVFHPPWFGWLLYLKKEKEAKKKEGKRPEQ